MIGTKQQRQKDYWNIILFHCAWHEVECKQLMPTQFRIYGKQMIDVYPNSNKAALFFEYKTTKFITFHDIIQFCNKHIGKCE